jgi:molybdenum cofactor biosynthesis enzyme MoaA
MLHASKPIKPVCKFCELMRISTKGKKERCLRHDDTISEEWRQKVRVPLEPLPERKSDDVDSEDERRDDSPTD